MVIDSHHHFWRYTAAEYGWIGDGMATIRRDFLPEHLDAELTAAGVDGAITVQARQTVEETAWLLELARSWPRNCGVVGWVPLCDPRVGETLERFAASPALRGVRHVVQGEPDDEFMLRPDFNRGVSALGPLGLVYEILIFERQLPAAIRFADLHPDLRLVLDHVAKPRIRDGELEPWASRMRELARRPNLWCKLSGMVTEADYGGWTVEQLRPYVAVALDCFGPERLLFGSDWPVCLVACSYGRWVRIVREAIADLSQAEQAAILGGNAARVYGCGHASG
jgi:L-fuconolactonase